MALQKTLRVLEKSNAPNPFSVILQNRKNDGKLLFESGVVALLSNNEYDQIKKNYKKICDAYGCLGVLQMNCGETCNQYLIVIINSISVGKIGETEIFKITQTQFIPLQYEQNPEDRITEIRKFLNSGTFYFGYGGNEEIDITLCAQRRFKTTKTDNRFFWNRMLHLLLIRFGIKTEEWLIKAMCGSIEIKTIYVGHRLTRAVLISRLSCERAGTRFNTRGCNDDGHVANFVETEQLIYLDGDVTSFVQIRGSIPLFWEQSGVQVGAHKIKLTRENSNFAFDKHMRLLRERYGFIGIVNLLSTTSGLNDGETFINNEFQRYHQNSNHSELPHILFDYHSECRTNQNNLIKLKNELIKYRNLLTYFTTINSNLKSQQLGLIRTNCLDCLDRTNSVQTEIGLMILEEQLVILLKDVVTDDRFGEIRNRFVDIFKEMWSNMGNEISKIYAGTGAIQGSSKFIDGARSAARTIQNNLLDNSKQEAIDVLLFGSTLNCELADRSRTLLPSFLLHAPTPVLREMCKRYREFTHPQRLRVGVGTYNVNGGKQFKSLVFKDISLINWLQQPHETIEGVSPSETNDIYALGFEEIVDLSATNIVSASSENARQWCTEITKVLETIGNYVLISYQQLVGVCLFIYAKQELVAHIRDVAIDCVKTGLGGATGNKGAVAIRFVLHGTSMCFVCAHFAAGQSQVHERNADFAEITRKIQFPMNRTLNSHDYVFFAGDFNYRIDLERNQLKEMIKNELFDEILKEDQLTKQQQLGNCFRNYFEGDIDFAPTYKYDLFSDDYDTSEKSRAPAWTDRILWRKRPDPIAETEGVTNGVCLYYGRTELKQSDHRPVFAVIDIDINIIDPESRVQQVYYDVLEYLGPPDGTISLKLSPPSDIIDYDTKFVNDIVTELSKIGRVVMVRFDGGDTMWATFHDPQCCLAALKRSQITVNGFNLKISLKSPNWIQEAEKELTLSRNNTISIKLDNVDLMTSPHSGGGHRPPPLRPPKPNITPAVVENESGEISFDRPEPNFKPPPLYPPPQPDLNNPPPIPARINKPPPLIPTRPCPPPPSNQN